MKLDDFVMPDFHGKEDDLLDEVCNRDEDDDDDVEFYDNDEDVEKVSLLLARDKGRRKTEKKVGCIKFRFRWMGLGILMVDGYKHKPNPFLGELFHN